MPEKTAPAPKDFQDILEIFAEPEDKGRCGKLVLHPLHAHRYREDLVTECVDMRVLDGALAASNQEVLYHVKGIALLHRPISSQCSKSSTVLPHNGCHRQGGAIAFENSGIHATGAGVRPAA